MASKKSFVKGLALGAILAAAAHVVMDVKEHRSADAKKLKKATGDIAEKVARRALRLGKLTKSAYGQIVDTTVAEYRGMKALSEDELLELRMELMDGWEDLKTVITAKPKTAKKPAAKKRK